MERPPRGLQRALLRECRRLGPSFCPSPPASELLWGRGFQLPAGGPHPRLLQVAPRCLHKGLGGGSKAPLVPWLRSAVRTGLSREGGGSELVSEAALEFLHAQSALAACTSTGEERGLRVEAVSGFVGSAAAVKKGQHVFSYNMRFTNFGKHPVRVLGRQYDFREGSGALATQIRAEQPEAAGVVGYTPLLRPGESFEFGSGVVLSSPRGSVTGRFLAMVEPELSGEDAELHRKMEEAELVIRFVYLKGLGTEQFHVPLGQLRFDAAVPCLSLRREAAAASKAGASGS